MPRTTVCRFGLWVPITALFLTTAPVAAQSTYTWNTATTNTAWLNSSNWTGGTPPGVFPGTTNGSLPNQGNALDTAVFGTFAAAIGTNGVGIDFTSANGQFGIGAIQLTTGTGGNLRIGNSSATPGDTFLNGAMVSSVSNVVLANTSGSRNLILDNTPAGTGSQTMHLVIGTVPTSVILVNSGGTITVNSVISESAFPSGFIVQGGGTVVLAGTNLFNGSVAITGGSILSVSKDTNFGNAPTIASPGKIVLNDGVLSVTTGFSLTAFRGVVARPNFRQWQRYDQRRERADADLWECWGCRGRHRQQRWDWLADQDRCRRTGPDRSQHLHGTNHDQRRDTRNWHGGLACSRVRGCGE